MLSDYRLKNYNFRVVVYMMSLVTIGVLAIKSATNNDPEYVSKQIMGIIMGMVLMIGISLISYRFILNLYGLIYLSNLALLIAVLFLGKNVNNATRWIILPGIGQIQPSEFSKIALILFFSWFLGRYRERINSLITLILIVVLFAIPIVLILEQPDLSTSLVIVFILVCMVFVTELSYKWIAGLLVIMTPVAAWFIYTIQQEGQTLLHGYQARRILSWIDPEKYADAYYQQENSIMAIGSGQLLGKGLNNNTLESVKNGNFLSEEQTDFIFAIIGEELGFAGSVLVITLLALIIYETLLMAHRAKDMSGRLICTGMASLIAFQGFANIAVATGLFPNTGLPLPFISSGVSSLISIFIGMGFVLNVGLQRSKL